MNKTRITYFIWILITIILGLISRKISYLPLWLGDMLWGIMIFFLMKLILVNKPTRIVAIGSLIICYLVEFSQLYQAEWINAIRSTRLGHLVLGQGFLWSDLLAYTVGIVTVSWMLHNHKKRA